MTLRCNSTCFKAVLNASFKLNRIECGIWTLQRSITNKVGGNDYQYESVIKNFRWKIPEFWNFANDVIDVHARNPNLSNRPAFVYIPESPDQESINWTYRQLSDISKVYAGGLASNLGSIKRAIIILPKVPEWWILNIAALRTNTILLPGTSMLTETDIDNRLFKSSADCIIVDADVASKVENIAAKHKNLKFKIFVDCPQTKSKESHITSLLRKGWISLESIVDNVSVDTVENLSVPQSKSSDVMQIYFTSGTTGAPKMVGHTHGSYGFCHWVTGKYWLDLTPGDIHWNIADTGWAKSAWSSVFAPWIQGATVFAHGMSRFAPDQVLKALRDHPVTTLCAPPTLYRSIVMQLRHELAHHCLPQLRHCVSAGEPLNEEVIRIWKNLTGIWIKEGYGQTETALIAATFKGMDVRPGSMGKAAPGFDVRILDETGQEVEHGLTGVIAFKAKNLPEAKYHPGLFSGYIGDSEKTEKSFNGDFYLTGDRGFIDKDGYIWFAARADDVIISAGYRIGPFEVESVLLEHEAVAESAVVGSPDEDRGHVVKAFIILKSEFQERLVKDKEAEKHLIAEIQNFVKSKTAPYKYPRRIEFVPLLPKTVSGKIRRAVLRQQEEDAWREKKPSGPN